MWIRINNRLANTDHMKWISVRSDCRLVVFWQAGMGTTEICFKDEEDMQSVVSQLMSVLDVKYLDSDTISRQEWYRKVANEDDEDGEVEFG